MLNTRKVVENKAITSTPFKQPQEEKNKQNIKGIPTKEQKSLADELIERDKERIKRESGDGDVIIRVIFEGARKPDGDHDDTIIEQEIKKGNPNKPKEIYQIYVKGLTENNGLTAAGSIIRRWLTEDNIPKLEVNRGPLIPLRPFPVNPTLLPPQLVRIIPGVRVNQTRRTITAAFGSGASWTSQMTHQMLLFSQMLFRNFRNRTVLRIAIQVNIGANVDLNTITRSGFANINPLTRRVTASNPMTLAKFNNSNTPLINIQTQWNEFAQLLRTNFQVPVTIKFNINQPLTGITSTITFN